MKTTQILVNILNVSHLDKFRRYSFFAVQLTSMWYFPFTSLIYFQKHQTLNYVNNKYYESSFWFFNMLNYEVLLSLFQSLLQEVQICGRGGVLEAPREAESGYFLLWFHSSLVQEVVGVNMVNYSSIRQSHHHLHREVVAVQM